MRLLFSNKKKNARRVSWINAQKNARFLFILGIFLMAIYSFIDIDLGDRQLSSEEAWSTGVAPVFVFSCGLLSLWSWLYYRGYCRMRWLIILWCPLHFSITQAWLYFLSDASFDLWYSLVVGGLISLFWIDMTLLIFPKWMKVGLVENDRS